MLSFVFFIPILFVSLFGMISVFSKESRRTKLRHYNNTLMAEAASSLSSKSDGTNYVSAVQDSVPLQLTIQDLDAMETGVHYPLQEPYMHEIMTIANDIGTSNITDALHDWVLDCKPSMVSVTRLLHTLTLFHPELPKDYRSLMGTARNIETKSVEPGKYYHFGLLKGLEHAFLKLEGNLPIPLEIDLFIDGLQLFASNVSCCWPILGRIIGIEGSVFIIGIYFGNKKPSNSSTFLKWTIDDLENVFSCYGHIYLYCIRSKTTQNLM